MPDNSAKNAAVSQTYGLFPEFCRPKTPAFNPYGEDDANFDYYDDNAEAQVYITTYVNGFKAFLYVMRRHEAQAFCSRPETAVMTGTRQWMCIFTTRNRDWRKYKDKFQVDDGRFDALIEELGIKIIYRRVA